VLDGTGLVLEEERVRSTAESLQERFGALASIRMVIETGTQSRIKLCRVHASIATRKTQGLIGVKPRSSALQSTPCQPICDSKGRFGIKVGVRSLCSEESKCSAN
jgi:hypothetical protein